MTHASPLGGFLIAGFFGGAATVAALAIAGLAWWALLLGYSLGGTISVLAAALIWAGRDSALQEAEVYSAPPLLAA